MVIGKNLPYTNLYIEVLIQFRIKLEHVEVLTNFRIKLLRVAVLTIFPELEFVSAVSAGGSVKLLPAV